MKSTILHGCYCKVDWVRCFLLPFSSFILLNQKIKLFSWVLIKVLKFLHKPEIFGVFKLESQKSFLAIFWLLVLTLNSGKHNFRLTGGKAIVLCKNSLHNSNRFKETAVICRTKILGTWKQSEKTNKVWR